MIPHNGGVLQRKGNICDSRDPQPQQFHEVHRSERYAILRLKEENVRVLLI